MSFNAERQNSPLRPNALLIMDEILCATLRFQDVFVFLMYNNFLAGVCY